MRFQRDHYEGTPFSTAEGLAAGPFGNPNRFDVGPNGVMTQRQSLDGEFPRDISLFRLVLLCLRHRSALIFYFLAQYTLL